MYYIILEVKNNFFINIKYFIDFKLFSNSFPLVNDMKSNIKVIKLILEEVEDKIFNCIFCIILLIFEIIVSLSSTSNVIIELLKEPLIEELLKIKLLDLFNKQFSNIYCFKIWLDTN